MTMLSGGCSAESGTIRSMTPRLPAICGGEPVRRSAPPAWPIHDERELSALQNVLHSGNWGGYPSPNLHARRFAEAFAAFHDARYGVLAANGSVTLKIALRAAGIQAGDEVIVPPLTWLATAAAPLCVGAVPVFADIDPRTYCLDPEAVEAAITDRTRAIIPVHLGCRMADVDRLMEVARAHDLVVIEDCAHAHGARWRDRGAGSIGHLGSFSFQSSKLMTAGEGGILLTQDEELYHRCLSLVNCGRKVPPHDGFDGVLLGWNDRITEWQAAVLSAQLERLESQTAVREDTTGYLYDLLGEVDGLDPLYRDPRITRSANYYVILRYRPEAFHGLPRERFAAALTAEGFECTASLYRPIHKDPGFRVRAADHPQIRDRYGDELGPESSVTCPHAERAADEAVWFHHPIFLEGRGAMDQLVEAVRKIRHHASRISR